MAGYPVGSTLDALDAMRYHHLRHHRDLGFPSDPYLKPWVDHRIHHLHPQAALENLPELSHWYAVHRSDIDPP
jgi:hypothetical protein